MADGKLTYKGRGAERCGAGALRRTVCGRALFLSQIALFIFFIAALPGCATAPLMGQDELSTKQLAWPPAPAPARIRYRGAIEKPQDIGARTGFFAKVADFLLGAQVDNILKPYGLTVDGSGRLIVADNGLKRVHIFDIKGKEYLSINQAGNTHLKSPIAATVDGAGNIYVTDSALGKVFVFSPGGKFLSDFNAGVRPTGIAIDKKRSKLYVTDTASHNIGVYDLDGTPLETIGHFGAGPGEFNRPVDLFMDAAGELYVTDTMNYRIQIFDQSGRFSTMFGRHGDGTGDFGRPKGVSVDRDGNIYVVDALFDTVQIFNRKGDFLLNFGTVGNEAGTFWLPSGLVIDGNGTIFVADTFNRRVQVFEYLGGG